MNDYEIFMYLYIMFILKHLQNHIIKKQLIRLYYRIFFE